MRDRDSGHRFVVQKRRVRSFLEPLVTWSLTHHYAVMKKPLIIININHTQRK